MCTLFQLGLKPCVCINPPILSHTFGGLSSVSHPVLTIFVSGHDLGDKSSRYHTVKYSVSVYAPVSSKKERIFTSFWLELPHLRGLTEQQFVSCFFLSSRPLVALCSLRTRSTTSSWLLSILLKTHRHTHTQTDGQKQPHLSMFFSEFVLILIPSGKYSPRGIRGGMRPWGKISKKVWARQ